jgi:hypothetical protein
MACDRRWLWVAGAAVAVLGALAWGVPLGTLLALAALLACPAAMLFGMRMTGRTGEGGMTCHADVPGDRQNGPPAPLVHPRDRMRAAPLGGPAGPPESVPEGDPMLILKRRLAAGQITLDEYARLAAVISGSPMPSASSGEQQAHDPD